MLAQARRSCREGYMVDGIMVLVIAIGVLAALWAVVIYGSTFFGPKTN